MRRLLRALALGCALCGWLAAPALATEPTVGEVARAVTAVGEPGDALVRRRLAAERGRPGDPGVPSPTHGLLGLGGLIAFLLGAFLILAPPETALPLLALLEANRPLLAAAGGLFGLLGLVAVRAAWACGACQCSIRWRRLTGARGVAASALAPDGTVLVRRERWSAVAEGPPVGPGEAVRDRGP